jgi:hypothetical protein
LRAISASQSLAKTAGPFLIIAPQKLKSSVNDLRRAFKEIRRCVTHHLQEQLESLIQGHPAN